MGTIRTTILWSIRVGLKDKDEGKWKGLKVKVDQVPPSHEAPLTQTMPSCPDLT